MKCVEEVQRSVQRLRLTGWQSSPVSLISDIFYKTFFFFPLKPFVSMTKFGFITSCVGMWGGTIRRPWEANQKGGKKKCKKLGVEFSQSKRHNIILIINNILIFPNSFSLSPLGFRRFSRPLNWPTCSTKHYSASSAQNIQIKTIRHSVYLKYSFTEQRVKNDDLEREQTNKVSLMKFISKRLQTSEQLSSCFHALIDDRVADVKASCQHD